MNCYLINITRYLENCKHYPNNKNQYNNNKIFWIYTKKNCKICQRNLFMYNNKLKEMFKKK